MEGKRWPAGTAWTVVAALAVMASMAAGCSGSSSDGEDGAKPRASSEETSTSGVPQDGGGARDANDAAEGHTPDSGGSGSSEQEIRRMYDAFIDAFNASDAEAICSHLTHSAKAVFEAMNEPSGTCVEGADRLLEANEKGRPNSPRDRATIVSLRVNGDRAVGRAKTPRSLPYTVPFAKIGGEWKVAGDSRGSGG